MVKSGQRAHWTQRSTERSRGESDRGRQHLGQTRILTTAIALETGRGEFALAIALGIVLLLLALIVNAALGVASERTSDRI